MGFTVTTVNGTTRINGVKGETHRAKQPFTNIGEEETIAVYHRVSQYQKGIKGQQLQAVYYLVASSRRDYAGNIYALTSSEVIARLLKMSSRSARRIIVIACEIGLLKKLYSHKSKGTLYSFPLLTDTNHIQTMSAKQADLTDTNHIQTLSAKPKATKRKNVRQDGRDSYINSAGVDGHESCSNVSALHVTRNTHIYNKEKCDSNVVAAVQDVTNSQVATTTATAEKRSTPDKPASDRHKRTAAGLIECITCFINNPASRNSSAFAGTGLIDPADDMQTIRNMKPVITTGNLDEFRNIGFCSRSCKHPPVLPTQGGR